MARKSIIRPKSSPRHTTIGLWLVGGLAVIALLVVVLLSQSNSRGSGVVSAPPEVPAAWINGSSLGAPDAPVVVQGWEDFLCPACGQWNISVKPQLMENYIKTGKVRFEYRYFPLSQHGPGAVLGAMASQCAADQDAFWPYHDYLFRVAGSQGAAGFTLDKLIQHANDLKLDVGTFTQCMSSQKYRPLVQESLQEATQLQLSSTPTIIVNGKQMGNPFDFTDLSVEIDELVAAAGG